MNASLARRPPLWSRRDARALAALVAFGAVLIAAAWFFAAGRADAGDQMAFLSLAVVGVALGTVASGGWVMKGRRAVGARRRRLLGAAPVTAAVGPRAQDLVAGPAAAWFHRSDCLLVESRRFAAFSLVDHQAAGRRACPACLSDGSP